MTRFAGGAGLLVMAAMASCLLCGCTGRGGQSLVVPGSADPAPGTTDPVSGTADPAPGGLAGLLPPPSLLAALSGSPRSVSYVEADLVRAGEDFDPLLPNNRVTAGAGVSFDPAWSGPPDGTDLLAYCMYGFSLPGYDRNAQVRLDWSAPPGEIHEAWIGLADWGPDCWRWYPCHENGVTNMASLSRHIAFGGGLLLCIAVYGVDNSTLAEVRIGTQLPTASFTPATARGFPPLTLEFDASASSDPDGTLVKYEWDFNGDGAFETSSGLSPTVEHTFNTPGTFPVKVRVRDNDGMMASATGSVGVAGELALTWGTAGDDRCEDIAADSAGNYYLVGSTWAEGIGTDCLIAKFSAAGQPLWARKFGGGQKDVYTGVVVGSDDLVYVCGNTYSFGYTGYGGDNGLLQCWDPDGSLVWSEAWGGAYSDEFNGLTLGGGDIFVAGTTRNSDNQNAAVVRFTTAGEIVWARHFGADLDEELEAIGRSKMLFNDAVIHVVGSSGDVFLGDIDVLYCTLSDDGVLLTSKTYGDDTNLQIATAICPTVLGGETIIVGTTTDGFPSITDLLILCPTYSWARSWNGLDTDEGNSVARLPDGTYLIGGRAGASIQNWQDAVLLSVTPEGLGAGLERRDFLGQHDTVVSLLRYMDGFLLGGTAVDNTAEWEFTTLSLGGHAGEWKNLSWTAVNVGHSPAVTPFSVTEITDGVKNTGGGGKDMLFEVRKQ